MLMYIKWQHVDQFLVQCKLYQTARNIMNSSLLICWYLIYGCDGTVSRSSRYIKLKRRRDNCTCDGDKKTVTKRARRRRNQNQSLIMARGKRTPQRRARDKARDKERKKRGRTPYRDLGAIYPCIRCKTFYKRKHNALKCSCQAVFLFTFIILVNQLFSNTLCLHCESDWRF